MQQKTTSGNAIPALPPHLHEALQKEEGLLTHPKVTWRLTWAKYWVYLDPTVWKSPLAHILAPSEVSSTPPPPYSAETPQPCVIILTSFVWIAPFRLHNFRNDCMPGMPVPGCYAGCLQQLSHKIVLFLPHKLQVTWSNKSRSDKRHDPGHWSFCLALHILEPSSTQWAPSQPPPPLYTCTVTSPASPFPGEVWHFSPLCLHSHWIPLASN